MARHRAPSHPDALRAFARPSEGRPALRRARARPGLPGTLIGAAPHAPVAIPVEPEDDRALARMMAAAFLGGVGIWVGLGLWLL